VGWFTTQDLAAGVALELVAPAEVEITGDVKEPAPDPAGSVQAFRTSSNGAS